MSVLAFALPLIVVAMERTLLTALHLDLNVSGLHWRVDLQVDLASDSIAGLIERALRLELDVAARKLAALVREEKHLLF